MLVIRVVDRNRICQHAANLDHLVLDSGSESLLPVGMIPVERLVAEATEIRITGGTGHVRHVSGHRE